MQASVSISHVEVDQVEVSAYTIPTDLPESDGTLEWDATTLVLVELSAGDVCGLGSTYGEAATGKLIADKLAASVVGHDAMNVSACSARMTASLRNLGCPGITSMAIAAVDTALWDLKAHLLDLPLVALLGARTATPSPFTEVEVSPLTRIGSWPSRPRGGRTTASEW